ncbi:MAG TPA: PH domain-containing protein [Candidatus Limnocylindria bacterium]
MSYARNLLSRGEEVVFESRQHWFAVLAETWLYVIIAILALAVLIWTSTTDTNTFLSVLQIASLVALLASLAMIGLKVWAWRNQEYLITTRRVIKAQGIFNKEMGDSSLEKVNDARLTQSWLGRIFDYGTLDILTASEAAETGLLNDFNMIAEPVKFKVAMLNQKERLEFPDLAPPPIQRAAPMPSMQRAEPMPPRAGSDRVSEVRSEPMPAPASSPAAAPPAPETHGGSQLAATLESLAGLRDKGLITPEEYEAKKRELLERM